ncbi:MAG: hypothetical protein AB7S78_06885 [Candidatus Omnitrophota bacterium]
MTAWHTPPDRWENPRIFHSEFQTAFEDRVVIRTGRWPESAAEPVWSPNGAYRLVTVPPDFSREGPWNTRIYIDHERGSVLVVEIKDHNQWMPQVEWINEKLVYVSVWWGRILGSYFIIDVEQEKIIAKEMIHDGQIAYQQYQSAGEPNP